MAALRETAPHNPDLALVIGSIVMSYSHPTSYQRRGRPGGRSRRQSRRRDGSTARGSTATPTPASRSPASSTSPNRSVEVYSEPSGPSADPSYRRSETLRPGQSLAGEIGNAATGPAAHGPDPRSTRSSPRIDRPVNPSSVAKVFRHARPEIRPGQRRGRQAELPGPERLRRRRRGGRPGRRARASGRGCSSRSRRPAAARTRWRRRPARRRTPTSGASWSSRGSGSRPSRAQGEERLKGLDGGGQAAARPDPQPHPPRRPDRRDRGPERRAAEGRHASRLRLQAEGSRRDRQGARPDRLRGRRQGLGHRLLLPQERRGAPGDGPPAVRHRQAGQKRGFIPIITPDLARVQASWKGSASTPGARRRRSTPSRSPTSA